MYSIRFSRELKDLIKYYTQSAKAPLQVFAEGPNKPIQPDSAKELSA